jgi:hypothetical protein
LEHIGNHMPYDVAPDLVEIAPKRGNNAPTGTQLRLNHQLPLSVWVKCSACGFTSVRIVLGRPARFVAGYLMPADLHEALNQDGE